MHIPFQIFSMAAIFVLFCAGCSGTPQSSVPAPVAATKTASFATLQTLAIGQSLKFDDGLEILLVKIDDSRCAKDVQCIWAGELAPLLHLHGGAFGPANHELRLGTERAKEVSQASYAFSLYDATTTSATLIVTQVSARTETEDEMIRVTAPQTEQVVTSPFTVTGEARGPWYFEASFLVKLLDANGDLLAQTHGQAQDEWMTEKFVAFTATLKFRKPTTATGTLILEKDNPAGEAQHADSRRIPVRFVAVAKRAASDGGVYGSVRIGPTCPVATTPPNPNCADKPYSTSFIIASRSGERVATVKSGHDGRFWMPLPLGTFVIRMQNEAMMISMVPKAFTVDQNGYTELQLSLDNGIR